jgi:RNA polymerase sigma-70 factor (ECF subfamily)
MLPRKRIQRHLSPVEEAQLVERLRTGDRSAQAEVVRRYRRMLLHQAFAVVHQWTLAEDAVQDTWILAFKNIERFEGRSTFRTWLAGIAINQARKYRRQDRRSPPLSAVLGRAGDPAASAPPSASMPLPEPVNDVSAEDMMLEREQGRAIKNALRRLPVTQRSVLVLQLQGYSPAETRTTLRISEVARRVRLSRARARLRKAFRWDVRCCA